MPRYFPQSFILEEDFDTLRAQTVHRGLVFRGDCRYGDKLAYYGDRLSELSLKRPLKASGRVTLRRGVSDSTSLIGFFHSKDSVAVNPSPEPAPGPATPNINPYMPTGDTGGAQFVAAHPTWDGRGVTVGIVDSGVTLDHPSLLTTTTGERRARCLLVTVLTGPRRA